MRNSLRHEVHIISRKKLREAATRYRDLESPLDVWFRIAKKASWQNLADVRKTTASADLVNRWTVFHVKGNRHRRLVTEINYRSQPVYVRHVLTTLDTTGRNGSNEYGNRSTRIRDFTREDFTAVIDSEKENEHYTALLEELDDRQDKSTPAEQRLAELLVLLIEDFEEKHYCSKPGTGIEALEN
jgi:mRNA interferase HigB